MAAAVRTGDIPVGTGINVNELYPNRYPAKQVQVGLTREQVKAELAEAIRTGDFMEGGEISVKHIELHPDHYLHSS